MDTSKVQLIQKEVTFFTFESPVKVYEITKIILNRIEW